MPVHHLSCHSSLFVKPQFTICHVTIQTRHLVSSFKDGTVEKDIPSMELFPVHHLDDLEFFPGDFVLSTVGKLLCHATYWTLCGSLDPCIKTKVLISFVNPMWCLDLDNCPVGTNSLNATSSMLSKVANGRLAAVCAVFMTIWSVNDYVLLES